MCAQVKTLTWSAGKGWDPEAEQKKAERKGANWLAVIFYKSNSNNLERGKRLSHQAAVGAKFFIPIFKILLRNWALIFTKQWSARWLCKEATFFHGLDRFFGQPGTGQLKDDFDCWPNLYFFHRLNHSSEGGSSSSTSETQSSTKTLGGKAEMWAGVWMSTFSFTVGCSQRTQPHWIAWLMFSQPLVSLHICSWHRARMKENEHFFI